jgi:hypothetical protein
VRLRDTSEGVESSMGAVWEKLCWSEERRRRLRGKGKRRKSIILMKRFEDFSSISEFWFGGHENIYVLSWRWFYDVLPAEPRVASSSPVTAFLFWSRIYELSSFD